MRPFNILRPASLEEAIRSAASQQTYIAGGTSLVDLMKLHIAEPDTLIDITKLLPDKIEETSTGIRIGAMVRNSAIASHQQVQKKYPLLAKALLAGASPQIRNMASTGGNLLQRTRCPYYNDKSLPCNKRTPGSGCSAIEGENRTHAIVGYSDQCVAVHPSDFCVALTALDATIVVTEKNGQTTRFVADDFFRVPGNEPERATNLPEGAVIRGIELEKNDFAAHHAYLKLRDRDSYAFALVSVAAALSIEDGIIRDARLASGGVAHKPWRWKAAEQFLQGKTATPELFAGAADRAVEGLQPLSKNGYKIPLLHGAIETALQQCLTA